MSFESIQSFREGSQAKRHPRSEKPHLLVMEVSFVSHDRHWVDHRLFAAEKMCQRLIKQAHFKTRTPISDQSHQRFAEKLPAKDTGVKSSI